MEQILTTFGIDWRLLIINAINFALVLTVLTYFLYKPIMGMLEKRRQVLEEGVKNAELAGQELTQIQNARAGMLEKAGKEADDVLASARTAGAKREKEIVEGAEHAAATLSKEAEMQAKEMKDKAISEAKIEVAKLIVLGVEKAMQK